MQNKGFVTFVTVSLALVCAFYLSFSFVTSKYDKKAEAMGEVAGKAYLDSMANEKVWLGYTLKDARKQQIGLGLDLKGGMNVVLKLNAGELLRTLAAGSEDEAFHKAIELSSRSGGGDFIEDFVHEYKKLSPNANLAVLFGAGPLRDKITTRSTEAEVVALLNEQYESAIETSFNVLRTRIDRFGVVAPNLQRMEGQGRILVELPGVKDPERVRELLQRSANLQFWRTYSYNEVSSDLLAADARLAEMSRPGQAVETTAPTDSATVAEAATDSLAQMTTDTTATAEAKQAEVSGRESLTTYVSFGNYGGAVVGYARAQDMSKVDSMLALAKDQRLLREDLTLMWGVKPSKGEAGRMSDIYELYAIRTNRSMTPDLGGDAVSSASADMQTQFGRTEPYVSMTMNSDGAQKWARLTRDNINRSIAVVLDGVVYSAPNVNGEITGGSSQISGSFTPEEATDLANTLNSGKMTTSVVIEQESVVGPTLGDASIRAGIISFAIALVLLMVYMCIAYGVIPGMIANVALIINSFFTLGILASFGAVLTLPGIAGLVLTLGMAVDANVLINERIKEELRKGKDMTRAIADGYGNAFSAIFDSNITSILTGVVLFYFGTGPIRGFATTLIVGLVASFITAVFMTRMIFEALDKRGTLKSVTYDTVLTRNLLTNPNFDFLGARTKGFVFIGTLLIAGLVSLFTLKLNQGIEFSGGRNYVVKFDKQVNNDELRNVLAPAFDGKLVLTSIGTDGDQVRISTNYKIEDDSEAVEEEVKTKLYEGVKSFYSSAPAQAQFLSTTDYIVDSQKVSASMSDDIKREALFAVTLALLLMALYILIRFRNIAFSVGAFASVTVTTLIIISLYSLLWRVMPFTMEIDQNFIAAVLAIIGYAINDVVIIFDRIREEIGLNPKSERKGLFNFALNTTLTRTFNTSFTTLLVMLIVFAFGGASMRSFTFVILLGVVFGTFCTLFVASPVAYLVAERQAKKNA